jgi:hypothetical protein
VTGWGKGRGMVACKATKRSDGWWEKSNLVKDHARSHTRRRRGRPLVEGEGREMIRGPSKCTTRELTGNNKLGGEHQCEGPVIHLANLACHVPAPFHWTPIHLDIHLTLT